MPESMPSIGEVEFRALGDARPFRFPAVCLPAYRHKRIRHNQERYPKPLSRRLLLANHLVGAGANSRPSWHSSRRIVARRSRPAGSCKRIPAGAVRPGRWITENLDSRFGGLIELPLAHELVDTGAVAEADINVAPGIYPTAVPWTSAVEAGQYVP